MGPTYASGVCLCDFTKPYRASKRGLHIFVPFRASKRGLHIFVPFGASELGLHIFVPFGASELGLHIFVPFGASELGSHIFVPFGASELGLKRREKRPSAKTLGLTQSRHRTLFILGGKGKYR
jgi:hypothetical protein